jgi:hypothetical protein
MATKFFIWLWTRNKTHEMETGGCLANTKADRRLTGEAISSWWHSEDIKKGKKIVKANVRQSWQLRYKKTVNDEQKLPGEAKSSWRQTEDRKCKKVAMAEWRLTVTTNAREKLSWQGQQW